MHINSVAAAFPSRSLNNEDVTNEIARLSHNCFRGNLDKTLRYIRRMLSATGAETRQWLDDKEASLDVTLRACKQAIAKADNDQKIDLLIHASVYGEIAEPSTADLLAFKLGLNDTECMDMKQACEGWIRAMQVAQALIQSGQHHRIMVVNGEFSQVPGYAIRPKLFRLNNQDELEWRFPAYTVGEGAAATIVSASDEDEPWTFTNTSRRDLCDLCSVVSSWVNPEEAGLPPRFAKDGAGWFTSWAGELSGNGIPLSVETFEKSDVDREDVTTLFTHCSSLNDWSKIASQLGLHDKLYDIYKRFGNVVSAGIPVALALAESEGRLQRGDTAAVLVTSAGMTSMATSFQY